MIPIEANIVKRYRPGEKDYRKCTFCDRKITDKHWVIMLESKFKRGYKYPVHKVCSKRFLKRKERYFRKQNKECGRICH